MVRVPAFANVVFDLDGTLVDSLPGIEASLRAVLAVHQPGLSMPASGIQPLIGPPLAQIVQAGWPHLCRREVEEIVAAYRVHYLAESCAATGAFPGVAELLAELRTAGVHSFILTNKPRIQTEMILKRQGWAGLFEEIACADDPQRPFTRKEDARWNCGNAVAWLQK